VRLLDRYILRTYLRSLVGGLVVFSISAVVLDCFGRLGSFSHHADKTTGTAAEGWSGLEIFVVFYLSYLPFLLKLLIPFIALGSASFTVAVHYRANEAVPVQSAGTSARRLWAPILAGGLAVSALLLAFQEFVVPSLNREHLNVRRLFEGDHSDTIQGIPTIRDGRGTVLRAGAYRFSDRTLHRAVLLRPWQPEGFESWVAEELRADGSGWIASNGARVRPADDDRPFRDEPPGTRIPFDVAASEVEALVAKRGTAELSLGQLHHLMTKFPDLRSLRVAFHKEIARPLGVFVLTLVGVSFFLSVGRSVWVKGLATFLLAGVYYFSDIFCTSLGARGDLPSVVAAYLPLGLFFSLGFARWWTLPT
jgi:lipopolysaccharide export LptBFGC system permease protein LptF